MKYVSSAKESLNKIEDHILNVLSVRMEYLSKQGFTEDEVLTIITPSESKPPAKPEA